MTPNGISIEERMRRYPLELVPVGTLQNAWREMLVWYEYNEGSHVIMGRSPEDMLDRARRRLRRGAEWKSYWRFRVVAPPSGYIEKYATWRYEQEVDFFSQWVMGLISDRLLTDNDRYDEAERRIKFSSWKGLRPCVISHELEQECPLHCMEGFLPYTGTWESFYEEHQGLWQKQGWFGKVVKSRKKAWNQLDLLPPQEDEPIYVVLGNFGHHQQGLVITSVDTRTEFYFGNELFFFQGEERSIPSCFVEMREKYLEECRAKREQEQMKRSQDQTKYREEQEDVFLKLFPF